MLFTVFVFSILLLFLYVFIFCMDCQVPTARIIYRTFVRDTTIFYRLIQMRYFLTKSYMQNHTVGVIFQRQVQKNPNKTCFLFEDQTWTFQEVEDYSNQVANVFAEAGYRKGDEVALFMENRPEYVCIWLGLSKLGVVPALINTNLRLQSLTNSINAITPRAVIFNANLALAVKEVLPYLDKKSGVEFMILDSAKNDLSSFKATSLDCLLQNASKACIDETKYRINFTDKLFHIYTSGTTALPKAAIIRHSRFILSAAAIKFLLKIRDDDVIYNSLPMYHSAGGVLIISKVMLFGGTMVIRKKFSASNFWSDAVKYKATVAQYIGEVCRFLLSQPTKPEETQHTIRAMIGNGLRSQLWEKFQKRFHIQLIYELYASTEGNATLFNFFGKAAAIGFISRLFPGIYPVNLIKVDSETGEPLRGKNGLCVCCKPDEPGAIVGKIVRNNPLNSFDGYADITATNKKIIKNCFKKGDMAFHTGDIVVMDEDGYLYFLDRTGDTFRWRGENVSTTEVEGIISKALNLVPCVVYGIQIPGTEGRAGMAAIHLEANADLKDFYQNISASLPTYAVPIFLRICKQIEITGTHKLRKVDLQKEGFNPTLITDPIFMLNTKTRSYEQLDEEGYNRVVRGELRL